MDWVVGKGLMQTHRMTSSPILYRSNLEKFGLLGVVYGPPKKGGTTTAQVLISTSGL